MSFESGPRSNPKTEQWDRIRSEVERIVDKLRMPVDEGIKDSVVALRSLGFTTDASCEGHLDRALKAPWIDIGQVPTGLQEGIQAARLEARRMKKGDMQLDPETEKQWREIAHKLLDERARVIQLLDEFYRDRSVPSEQRLVIYPFGNSARIISQGAAIQDLYPREIQAKRLAEFQAEMKAFTEFLTTKFFAPDAR